MTDSYVPPLLALPRELRDIIIDDVLQFCHPVKIPEFREYLSIECQERWHTIDIPAIPRPAGLLHACAQLQAETLQRATNLDMPLVLDILVLDNGFIECTWVSRPLRTSTEWQNIDLKIQVRTQPVHEKLWQACYPTEQTKSKEFDYEDRQDNITDIVMDHRPEHTVIHLLVIAVTRVVTGVLWADLPGMRAGVCGKRPDRKIELSPINSIRHLDIEILPVLDKEDNALIAPYWEECDHDLLNGDNPDPCWDPNKDLSYFWHMLIDGMVGWWADYALPGNILVVRNYDVDVLPLFTHVGEISVRCGERAHCMWAQGEVPRSASGYWKLSGTFSRFLWRCDHGLAGEIKAQREKMGWGVGSAEFEAVDETKE